MIPHRLIGAQRTLSVCSRGESLPFGNWGRPSIKYFPYGVGGWGAQPHSMAFGGGTFFGRPPNQQFQLSGSGPNFSTRSLPVSHGVSSLFHSILGRFSSYSTWLASSKFFLAILFVFLYLYFIGPMYTWGPIYGSECLSLRDVVETIQVIDCF